MRMRFGNFPCFSSRRMCCGVYGTSLSNSFLLITRGNASSMFYAPQRSRINLHNTHDAKSRQSSVRASQKNSSDKKTDCYHAIKSDETLRSAESSARSAVPECRSYAARWKAFTSRAKARRPAACLGWSRQVTTTCRRSFQAEKYGPPKSQAPDAFPECRRTGCKLPQHRRTSRWCD